MVNILIVEDEGIVAMDLELMLKVMGYTVIDSVPSGEEALKIVENSEIDIVLMDIYLKGELNGIETAIQIRYNFDIPIVYTSANTDLKTHPLIKQTEPYEYLIKPFTDFQLQQAIDKQLKLQINENDIIV